ncbi:MAG: LamG domain-containing protein, partial [Limisphaerales bacterium]
PLAYYPLNEPSGSLIVYDMASGFNGTNQGGATFVSGVPNPPFAGFSGSEMGFETTYSSVGSWATAPFGKLGINNVTFTAWIYPMGKQTNWAGIVVSRTGGAEGGFGYNDAGMLDYTWNNGSTWSFHSGLVIPSNQWSFVAMVIQPTEASLYLYNTNGMASTNNVAAHTPDVFGNHWHIGNDAASADPTRTFNGIIDEVAIYAHSLTPAQIQQLYSVGATGVAGPIEITIERSGPNVILNWPTGTLLEATNLAGPWTTDGATAPYTVAPSGSQKFYRVRIP